jgi:hypothetical protein
MLANAQAATLQAGSWLTAAQIGELAGWTPSEADSHFACWLAQGKILAVVSPTGQELFPAYALDSSNCFAPVQQLADVIQILSPLKNSWGIAIWLASVNSYLSGKRPQDLILHHPEVVIRAAQDEAAGIHHG